MNRNHLSLFNDSLSQFKINELEEGAIVLIVLAEFFRSLRRMCPLQRGETKTNLSINIYFAQTSLFESGWISFLKLKRAAKCRMKGFFYTHSSDTERVVYSFRYVND